MPKAKSSRTKKTTSSAKKPTNLPLLAKVRDLEEVEEFVVRRDDGTIRRSFHVNDW
jgi:hypothetical protein